MRIIHGGKDVENRVRNLAGDYRGPVAIHAGLAYDRGSHLNSEPLREAQDRAAIAAGAETFPGGYVWDIGATDPREQWSVQGAIIGVVDLVAVHEDACSEPGDSECGGCCTPWAVHDLWHLSLRNARPLAEPIPYKGALGLRNLDEATVALIERQLA